MDLSIYERDVFSRYKSSSQIARVLTERWFEREMYCPACSADSLKQFEANRRAVDFFCKDCRNAFQLKASRREFGNRVVDGAYKTMAEFISANQNPTFFFLHYSPKDWMVLDLLIVPKFFVSSSFLEKREPLKKGARREGWVGCNLLLERIPAEGKILVVEEGKDRSKQKVRREWRKMGFLEESESRGWTVDVLKCVEEIGKKRFSLKEVYQFENRLKDLHPENHHIKAKIRQQLQILRDRGILKFFGNGEYGLL